MAPRLTGAILLGAAAALTTSLALPILVPSTAPVASAAVVSDPTLVAAGDVACSPNDPSYNGGIGTTSPPACQQAATASEIKQIGPQYLLALGDTQYDTGAQQGTEPPAQYYQQAYNATWGNLTTTRGGPVPNANIHPIIGNNEYGDVTDSAQPPLSTGDTYFTNFGPAGLNELPSSVTGASNDWYSYDVPVNGGTWHVVALDSECPLVGGCGSGSPEESWFRRDLAANAAKCTIVYWHEPRWSVNGNLSDFNTLWSDAVSAHVVMVLNSHAHNYQHWGPLDANGNQASNGTSELIVGTGGVNLEGVPNTQPSGLIAADGSDFGVLRLVLHSGGASYAFQTTSGTVPDSGTIACNQAAPPPSGSITAVGSLATRAGTGLTTLATSARTVGDAVVLAVKASSATASVASISGGGATTWTKLSSYLDSTSHDNELWLGTLSSTGNSTIAVSFSSSVASSDVDLNAQEFSSGFGSSSVWAKDTAGAQSNPSSTTLGYPSLTPAGSAELYFGYGRGPNTLSAGTTAGFTYVGTADGNLVTYNPVVSASSAPSATQSPAGTSASIGALISVS